MNTFNKNSNKVLWFTAILFVTLLTGCSDNNDAVSTPAITATPTVIAVSPGNTATAVPINNNISVAFSEAMDAATINTLSFTVMGAGEPALTGTVSLDAASNTAIFMPASDFTENTVYTITITTAAKNVLGKALATNYVWTFTTAATADTTASSVTSTYPADMVTDLAQNRNITANFSEALNPATVNATSFTLTDGVTPVSGVVSYVGTIATFDPTANLAANTLYTATLTTAITDLANPANALVDNVVWSFTTGTAVASGPHAVDLGTAGDFVILSKAGITNIATSAITGNIGTSPITAAALDNVSCAEIRGTIYGADAAYTGSRDVSCFAGEAADITLVGNAVLDMETAYIDAAGRTLPDFTEHYAGDISGRTLAPGLYKWSTGVSVTGGVTLSGGPNDVWIFQVSGDVTLANNSSVNLTGGAQSENIFWQVGGGAGLILGTNAHIHGVILAEKGVTVKTGTSVSGRIFAQTAVTLDKNVISATAP